MPLFFSLNRSISGCILLELSLLPSCNNEFTGLFHNIDFGQKKIVLIKRKFLFIKVA